MRDGSLNFPIFPRNFANHGRRMGEQRKVWGSDRLSEWTSGAGAGDEWGVG